jgi:hypothetical protein
MNLKVMMEHSITIRMRTESATERIALEQSSVKHSNNSQRTTAAASGRTIAAAQLCESL